MCSGARSQPSHKALMVTGRSQLRRSPWHWEQNTDAFLHRKYCNNFQNPSMSVAEIYLFPALAFIRDRHPIHAGLSYFSGS